ncbi:hypothetical protein RUM43_009033 [Polyplax serrata]|uniref:Uncharacterized protein n=1 Tax=Polyplax serrata TaxID=468196 RepID=A0AAN8NZ68_POLSC
MGLYSSWGFVRGKEFDSVVRTKLNHVRSVKNKRTAPQINNETVAELSCSTGWKAEGKMPLFSKYDRSKEADIIHIFAGWEALKIERTALTIRVERVVEESRSIDVKVQAKEFEVFEE